MTRIAILLMWMAIQDAVPYKPKDEFEIKVDLSFKQRVSGDPNRVNLDGPKIKESSTATLPYLKFKLNILKVNPQEIKARITRDDTNFVYNKKIKDGSEIKLDAGFTDDIKDRVSGYKFEIHFMTADKKVFSKILIEFDKEGYYFVNGEKRGKI